MALSRDNDYAMYLYTCNRCRGCASGPSPELLPLCPSYAKHGFFAYSGGGKGYVAQGIIEGKVAPSDEVQQLAMSCLMCGACARACPPGFDINAFIRDLRDHLVLAGAYANDAHRRTAAALRDFGNPYGRRLPPADLPAFTGDQDLLLWLGCRERRRGTLRSSLVKLLDAAGLSYGVLPDEPCCGAPSLDLGLKGVFEEQTAAALAAIENAGAGRVLFLCPHCAANLAIDGMEIGDLAAEPVTLPGLIAELIAEGTLALAEGPAVTAVYHDPCRLSRWLEEIDPPRDALAAVPGLELLELPRHGQWSYCCGAGGFAEKIVPDLADFAARERMAEAAASGAELVVVGCSFCEDRLKTKAGKRKVTHIVKLIADRIQS